jgi:hypothetical protein
MAAWLFLSPAVQGGFLLTFEGLNQGQQVSNFYNGGGGSNVGVSFTANAYALTHGNYGGEPTAPTVMALTDLTGPTGSPISVTMNVPGGFDTALSLYYTAIDQTPQEVDIWSGLNGTGTRLATLPLPVTMASSPGVFSPFVQDSITFSGVAQSAVFSGPDNQILFDNIATGSLALVPEPPGWSLFAVGIAIVLVLRIAT